MPVTASDLRKVIGAGATQLTDDELSLYITQGQLVVDELLSSAGLSAALSGAVALYLSAHFYVLGHEGGGLSGESSGSASESYKTWSGNGFFGTRFGQQACSLDTSGTLASLSRSDRGSFDFTSIRYTVGSESA